MGVVGGGGIGDFAVRVGYQRYEYGIMYVAIDYDCTGLHFTNAWELHCPKTRQKKVGGQKNEEVLFSNIRCYCNSYFSCLWGNKQADQKEDKEITVAVQLESSKDILEIAKKEAEKKGTKLTLWK